MEKYLYFAVTPDCIGSKVTLTGPAGNSFCYVKFGITTNDNLEVLRRGYTTHNPTIGFNKLTYNTNISKVFSGGSTDLGKHIEKHLHGTAWGAVGNTEWHVIDLKKALKLFEVFSKHDEEVIDKDTVKNFLDKLKNSIRR